MQPMQSSTIGNRPMSEQEYQLALWMFEHGTTEATDFIPQLEQAEVTPWRCPCGCASFNFQVRGKPLAQPSVNVLGDFIFGPEQEVSGIFIFSSGGTLSGVEVYEMAGDAPATLPKTEDLRPFGECRHLE